MEHGALLRQLYNDPANAAGFAGLESLYREAHARRPSVTRDEVRHFLEGDRTYTLFKPTRNRYPRLRTRPRGFLTDLQCDLADFQKLAEHNRGFRYLLVAVDVLSRRVFVEPARSKSSKDMKHAFDKLFRQLPHLPWTVFTDNVRSDGGVSLTALIQGVEFESREMRAYFKEKGVQKYASRSDDVKVCSRHISGSITAF